MDVIPAIDLSRGRCVRWVRGDPGGERVFSDDPVAVARRWAREGARWLHIVDLDGARQGHPAHLDVVRRLAAAVDIPLQVGGGLRTADCIRQALAAGATRVLVGTAALQEEWWPELRETFASLIVPALDVRDGRLVVEGWQREAGAPGEAAAPGEVAEKLARQGVKLALCTSVARDGTLDGPDIGLLEEVLSRGLCRRGMHLLAAGGIATPEHLRQLTALEPLGLEGVVVGRALYEGTLTLADALRAVA